MKHADEEVERDSERERQLKRWSCGRVLQQL